MPTLACTPKKTAPVHHWLGLLALPLLAEPALGSLEESRPSRPAAPRWLEDYRFLDDPGKRQGPFDAVRYQRLSESAWLQLGGELRYRAERFDKPYFGLRGVDHEDYLQQRLQLHADLHLFDGALRTFVQLQDTRSWGKELFSPTDQSRSEFHQAFVDGNRELAGGRFTARLGRQEMSYGSGAFVALRDTPNLRYSFDGLRLSWNGGQGHRLDAFAVHPVKPRAAGSFNDGSDHDKRFAGLYGNWALGQGSGLDLYGFSLETDDRRLVGLLGDERRYTLGMRLFGQRDGWTWSADLAAQRGELADARVSAWALSSEWGYNWQAPGKPLLALRADAASGDRRPGDDKVQTFDPLFPRNQVYGDAGMTTLANALIVGPRLGYSVHPRLRLEPAMLGVWKQRREDAAYFTGMASAPGTAGTDKRVGVIYKTSMRWLASANLTLDTDLQWFDAGPAITQAGGDDTAFLSMRGTFRF